MRHSGNSTGLPMTPIPSTFRAAASTTAFIQVLVALGVVALCCTLFRPLHELGFQLLLITVASQLSRLSTRQWLFALILGALALGLPVIRAALQGVSGADFERDLAIFAMAAFYLPTVAVVGRRVRKTRQRQLRQQIELAAALATLKTLSEHDALTGACNRRHGTLLLEQECQRQHRTHQPFCIAILDIDHFKRINDTHGHPCGDHVLTELVRLAQATLDPAHTVIRWGGEEFVVLVRESRLAVAADALRRLQARAGGHDWSICASGLRVDFSAGVAEHRENQTVTQTLANADAAMYAAKNQGRGHVLEHRD